MLQILEDLYYVAAESSQEILIIFIVPGGSYS